MFRFVFFPNQYCLCKLEATAQAYQKQQIVFLNNQQEQRNEYQQFNWSHGALHVHKLLDKAKVFHVWY